MELIYIILIFIAPGLFVKKYNEYKILVSRSVSKRNTIYEELFGIVVFSIIASGLTLFILKILGIYEKALYMSTLIESFNSISFLTMWIITLSIVTVVLNCLFEKIIKKKLSQIRRKYYDEKLGIKELSDSGETVWERIFFNKDINSMYVSIYKDGNYITSGYIDGWNAGIGEKRELRIERSTELERMRLRDEKEDYKNKWLKYVDFEYFDTETGILIKFYDPKEINEHWKDL